MALLAVNKTITNTGNRPIYLLIPRLNIINFILEHSKPPLGVTTSFTGTNCSETLLTPNPKHHESDTERISVAVTPDYQALSACANKSGYGKPLKQ